MNSFLQVFQTVLKVFEGNEIDYMIVGSLASIMYGEPRLTNDMDVVVDLKVEHGPTFELLFPKSHYYIPPLQIISQEIVNRGQFNIIHTESGLKIDMMLSKKSPHSVAEFSRRVRHEFLPDFKAFVATPEDIIIKKLDFYNEGRSEKHLQDIRGILSNTTIDRAYVDGWIERMGLVEIWALI